MAIQCLPEIEFRALNSHQISIQFKYCKMSEFETSHHLHFKESGQKQEFSLPKTGCFKVKVANKVSRFTSKQPILGREDLFLATFSISN